MRMASSIWNSYQLYLDFRENKWRWGSKAFSNSTRKNADDYRWIVKEVVSRRTMETSSGLDKESATRKVLGQLDEEFTTPKGKFWGADPKKGWSALALKNYCQERVTERNTATGIRARSPGLEDF